jgi:hypothetical protein
MRYTSRWTLLTGFFLLVSETPLWSQRVTGTISGRVTDNFCFQRRPIAVDGAATPTLSHPLQIPAAAEEI